MGAARPRTQGGDSPLHTKRRGLGGSQPCQHRDLGLPASELGTASFCVSEAPYDSLGWSLHWAVANIRGNDRGERRGQSGHMKGGWSQDAGLACHPPPSEFNLK